ncbi:RSP_2648 family PIN domain-containing protein [Profundibacter amoris]|uniref:PIN domain-containing protein n=1 Tax=Profundibacter amoris TaxID=2171755 RepID=A0A347UH52_9RHOB|nr:PIN domain-containing protein [Profundibacter amoris]AXX98180.1 PIN domain-containing protein [Profundibacter amoris]
MRVLIDACVLYPTVMREVLMGVARRGLFTPLWSARILEEWARAAARIGDGQEDVARGEIALLRAGWLDAEISYPDELEASLHLPDPNDTHVLAAAIAGKADVLLTMNLKDFPTRSLTGHGVIRRDPDGLLREMLIENPDVVGDVAEKVRQTAERLSGQNWDMRKLMKKARLPRLGKALVA